MKHLQSSKIWPHWPLALEGLLLIEGFSGFCLASSRDTYKVDRKFGSFCAKGLGCLVRDVGSKIQG